MSGKKLVGKRKTGLEEALEDIRQGRVYGPFHSVAELLKSCGVEYPIETNRSTTKK
uniref:hypothetical protein n=1 Tax=Alloprevotella sp. TaxID=1872471 RepID=UPI004029FF38